MEVISTATVTPGPPTKGHQTWVNSMNTQAQSHTKTVPRAYTADAFAGVHVIVFYIK